MQFREATADKVDEGEGDVLDGELRIDGDRIGNMLPLPLRAAGAIVLTLGGYGPSIVVRARRLWVVVAGPPGDREEGHA